MNRRQMKELDASTEKGDQVPGLIRRWRRGQASVGVSDENEPAPRKAHGRDRRKRPRPPDDGSGESSDPCLARLLLGSRGRSTLLDALIWTSALITVVAFISQHRPSLSHESAGGHDGSEFYACTQIMAQVGKVPT